MEGPIYEWGPWHFEPTEYRLTRDGALVPLPNKTLDLLSTLLRRSPRLVTKEEILAAVWPDATVEEGNIAFHIAALRKALDYDESKSAIETVRGKGYRFVHPVTIRQMPSVDRRITGDRRRAAPTREIPSPAIESLPTPTVAAEHFEIVNPGTGQENFPEGLGACISTKLEQVGIATLESADDVLTGQLHPTTNGFRVAVHLTRTSDRTRLWDWTFEVSADENQPAPGTGPDDERSRVQGLIATRIAEGLRGYFNLSRTR